MQDRSRTPKRPRDFNSRAFQTVAILTGTAPAQEAAPDDPVRTAAALLGQRGGLKGGAARAANLTPERRREIAQKAAAKRWAKSPA